ncbi:transcriptional regulator GlxA family with amidase domain [Kibdelosporangium banguiense]|uniref:Transcriptional regulator GlxA family with amidase domain n=1 Tax=Kibdelosporangium banguiense TaxID=1365924 RepID=A0ABS4TS70_9PSEU|nr:helix-turn-helix domain-containing protein [Kibdelosporangium banguiense]MBP2327241.1 transcriptional regulator GlxA family with amidase domain [Kibdelosporangium banguiense]
MKTVALAVMDGIQLLDIAAPAEIFGMPGPHPVDPWYEFIVCGLPAARIGGWFQPRAPRGWDEFIAADTVIVPAVRDVDEPPPADLVNAVRAAQERGARVAAISTGAFVLAAAGLLDGRRATTHWPLASTLAARYPRIDVDVAALFVDDGSVLTSAGKTAGMHLCVHIVRTDHGDIVANALARHLVLPPDRSAELSGTDPQDHVLSELLPWVAENLNQPLTVTDLARHANMSTRNLTRRFNALAGITPLQWLLTQRINRAQKLLETTNNSVDHIADQTGMGTAATLRRHFNRAIGVSPDTYRRTFRIRVNQLAG